MQVYDFNRAVDTSILDHLELSLSSCENVEDVNELWHRFKAGVCFCLERFVLKRLKRVARQNPWVTQEIFLLGRRVARYRKKKVRNKNRIQELSHTFKNELNNAKKIVFHGYA